MVKDPSGGLVQGATVRVAIVDQGYQDFVQTVQVAGDTRFDIRVVRRR